MSRIYVASSWRNHNQPVLVTVLREDGHEVYDFKNPRYGDNGFHWSDVGMPTYDRATNSDVPAFEYLEGIKHPIAQAGFKSDFDAMKWADACILMLPCGRSAHLEAGWFVGNGRRTAILLEGNGAPVTPELMYLMADLITPSINEVRDWLLADREAIA